MEFWQISEILISKFKIQFLFRLFEIKLIILNGELIKQELCQIFFENIKNWIYSIFKALELKNIEYEYRPIHLVNNGGEQYSEEYTKLNPKQEVPALLVDGQLLLQSVNLTV